MAFLRLQVQVQQLVHHVSANTDNLTAGIQTCRSVGGLLQTAISSSSDARKHIQSAEHDAGTSLRVASLHRRNENLAKVMAALSDVLFIQQKAAEAEYAASSCADARVSRNHPQPCPSLCCLPAGLLSMQPKQQPRQMHLAAQSQSARPCYSSRRSTSSSTSLISCL